MKGKLIHRGDGDYKLYVNETTYATTSNSPYKKLSKQNCDEIFGVIDVIDVTYKQVRKEFDGIIDSFTEAFAKQCINKAMELNKDKVFTLEDMKRAFKVGFSNGFASDIISMHRLPEEKEKLFNEFIQSLQQPTEVEIEMEKVVDETKVIGVVKGVKGSGDKITTYKSVPKLDSSGCLILTKKK
jgi:hypothetical protein